ncbi:MAG: biotin/lipoyl-binding protein [Candidatus Omnitrophica bacterium]|nr:biotin/lipoyl-binding protein [Candidatus Omnitrophota bacterium]
MKYRLSLALGVLLLASSGCQQQQAETVFETPEVATITVKTEPVELTTELPGRTSAYLVSEIRPQVNGLIQKRLFIEGSDIKQGQDLYQIDPAPFEAALDNSEASLLAARKDAERARPWLPLLQVSHGRLRTWNWLNPICGEMMSFTARELFRPVRSTSMSLRPKWPKLPSKRHAPRLKVTGSPLPPLRQPSSRPKLRSR